MKNNILFGLGPAGLFLGRELAKNGDKIYGVGRKDDIGLHSKFIEGYIGENKKEILKIVEVLKKDSNENPKAYICSDQYLTLILEEIPELFSLVEFVGIDVSNLELINNKILVTKYCEDLGLDLPNNYSYNEKVFNEVQYPIIIKLNTKEINKKKDPIGKFKILRNEQEFKSIINEIQECEISFEKLIIQTYIEGNNSNQYSFGGYYKNGEELAGIFVNQLRQYPQGVSSYVEEVKDVELNRKIKKKVNSFVKPIKYSGFLEMEFKISNKKIFLMDINPRPWGWVSILGKKYKNFHVLFSDKGHEKLIMRNELINWKSPLRDSVGYYKNSLNEKKVKKDRQKNSRTAYDIYDKSDIMPSLLIFKIATNKILKRKR